MVNKNVKQLVKEIEGIVADRGDEQVITQKVADVLHRALEKGLDLPDSYTRPDPDHYVMYPLHVDAENRFSIASAVWNVGQGTPVHGHETWGVVGIYSGQEHEVQYEKPKALGTPLEKIGEETWSTGQVTVCCTTDDDVHEVSCASSRPCVGIHVYGEDIGTLERRSYDPKSGDVKWFVSRWSDPNQK